MYDIFVFFFQFELPSVETLDRKHHGGQQSNIKSKNSQHELNEKTNSQQDVNVPRLNKNTRRDTQSSLLQEESVLFEKQLAKFVSSQAKELEFPPHLTPKQRALVHEKAEEHGLVHVSKGDGINRRIVVSKKDDPSQRRQGTSCIHLLSAKKSPE